MINQTQDNTTYCSTETIDCCDTTDTVKRPQNYRAPVDVYETDTEFRVIADMPGAEPITNEELLELECDFLVPAAIDGVIHAKNAPTALPGMVKWTDLSSHWEKCER